MKTTDNKASSSIKQVNCPTCQKTIFWSPEEKFRPFCSERCQLIDFGDWANEKNSIAVAESPEDFNLDDLTK